MTKTPPPTLRLRRRGHTARSGHGATPCHIDGVTALAAPAAEPARPGGRALGRLRPHTPAPPPPPNPLSLRRLLYSPRSVLCPDSGVDPRTRAATVQPSPSAEAAPPEMTDASTSRCGPRDDCPTDVVVLGRVEGRREMCGVPAADFVVTVGATRPGPISPSQWFSPKRPPSLPAAPPTPPGLSVAEIPLPPPAAPSATLPAPTVRVPDAFVAPVARAPRPSSSPPR